MIKCLILSAFLLLTEEASKNNFHEIWDEIIKYFQVGAEQSITTGQYIIKVMCEKTDSNFYQIITILGGFIIMVFQVYWQQKGNLKLQKESSRDTLKLKIYQEIEKGIAIFNNVHIKSYLTLMSVSLEGMHEELKNNSNPPTIINSRASVFLDYNKAAQDAAVDLCCLIERWEIICPEFKVFRLAIISTSHDFRSAFEKLSPVLIKYLPVELGDNENIKTVWPNPPTDEEIRNIQSMIENYLINYDQLSSFIYDIQVLSQNILLGNLFNRRIECREPLDPQFIALDFDTKSIEEWIFFF